MFKLKLSAIIFIVLSISMFAIQNADVVQINFLVWSFTAARFFIVLALLAIGFILGMIVSSILHHHRH